ncbi:MATE family efflux transporter [Hydrogenophaga crassostreae]|uniref:MATE family efflux transporter n=2 Tax=Hydrogenophaga crassostreae TaxID=1763535 RepID=A0A170AJI1_9BURK|nr:MATE family efflux transporter [Hydrogenophaga crassostreae]OAD44110.1 MATE family efflux transporter [Hydrogenophaga crassostreae]
MAMNTRPSLNAVAAPIFGEFLLGMTVAFAGLYLASHTSDAAAGTFGLTQQVLETLFVIFRVLAIGLGIVVTQSLGSRRIEAAKRTAYMALSSSTWAGLLVVALMVFGRSAILEVLNAPASVIPLAMTYMLLLAPALLLEAYNLSMASVLRAHLFARESLFIMIAMHGTHLLLAVLFMQGLGGWEGWGLNGYALAYFLSRVFGLWMHLSFWRRRMDLHPNRRHWWALSLPAMAPVLRIGVPGAALELGYRLAFMVSLSATARLGVAALATHSYTLQTLKYVLLISMAIGWACEIMVGRLLGAGRLKAADAMVRKGVRNGMLASGLLALAAAIGAPWIMHAFTRDPAIIAAAQQLLWMSVVLEVGRVFNLVVIGSLRATGDVHYPVIASLASFVLILGLGSYLLSRLWGLPGVWLAYVIDECLRGALMWWRWQGRGWLPHAKHYLKSSRHGPTGDP